ncbi:hypothetical protein [Burkholderia multivorans]|uniref:hypothetical protein n=1 Tax=Burkholderia multivorans TaxID=87883 RepID=UPI00158DC5C9|nr:hypothetical protein [Burkholderia multivorans]
MDFDPDALVLNAAYALCGPLGGPVEQHEAAPAETDRPISGLGRMTDEGDGFVTLQFVDEAAAQSFMAGYRPTVEVDDMPPLNNTQPEPPAADERAAEPVAQWQYRIRTPGYDGDWHNCNPETAKRLQEQPYAEDHDVRALYAAPQPAQADARVGLTDEQIETLAHRRAYRYRHGPDSIEFIFNRHCLLNFARALLQGANHAE